MKKIIALNPYAADSHVAFLNGWKKHSKHEIMTLQLPGHQWKWRMRHAAITFSEMLESIVAAGESYDAIFCTDMLNLAELKGLAPRAMSHLPTILYFHENQLTYPDAYATKRDLHYGFTNFVSCIAADAIWFNSQYHRTVFIEALKNWMTRMPDYAPLGAIDEIESKSSVHPVGINPAHNTRNQESVDSPLTILWAARWEDDKQPHLFFKALEKLKQSNNHFRLNVLGRSFGQQPECFEKAKVIFKDYIDHWGYAEDRATYETILSKSDVVVSTAAHEFFGIAVVEAVSAGAYPLVPNDLSYPHVLGKGPWLYDGQPETLARELERCIELKQSQSWPPEELKVVMNQCEQYAWPAVSEKMDLAVEELVR